MARLTGGVYPTGSGVGARDPRRSGTVPAPGSPMVPVIGGALALVAISDLDTNHFGIRAARADDVTTDSLPHIVQFCRDERVRLLIARCNAANLPTARVM